MKRAKNIRGSHGDVCVCCSCGVENRPMPWKTTPSRHVACPTCDCKETAAWQLNLAMQGYFHAKGVLGLLEDDLIDKETYDQVIAHQKIHYPEMFEF